MKVGGTSRPAGRWWSISWKVKLLLELWDALTLWLALGKFCRQFSDRFRQQPWQMLQLANPNPRPAAWRQQLQGDKRHYASPWHRPKPRRRDLVGLEFLHHGSTPLLSINSQLDSLDNHHFLHKQSSNIPIHHLRLLQVTPATMCSTDVFLALLAVLFPPLPGS
jgi:hypothetical protein